MATERLNFYSEDLRKAWSDAARDAAIEARKERAVDANARFNDINRQGFMKLGRGQPVKPKTPKPIVSCDRCHDWHREGEHTVKLQKTWTDAAREASAAARAKGFALKVAEHPTVGAALSQHVLDAKTGETVGHIDTMPDGSAQLFKDGYQTDHADPATALDYLRGGIEAEAAYAAAAKADAEAHPYVPTEPSATRIGKIHEHLQNGGRVLIQSMTRPVILNSPKHVDYIRAASDGRGYRLGWKGGKSVYTFPEYVQMIKSIEEKTVQARVRHVTKARMLADPYAKHDLRPGAFDQPIIDSKVNRLRQQSNLSNTQLPNKTPEEIKRLNARMRRGEVAATTETGYFRSPTQD